MSLSLHSNSVL